MSANQVPGKFIKDKRKTPLHSCPGCWKNGGPGHPYREVRVLIRRPASVPMPVAV